MSISNTHTYNLKVVLKETGIAADTLRAWERRYGLPKPGRTPGGHRLYSQRDIEIIKWLIAKQHEGLSISRAVNLWKELTASGQDPLITSPLGITTIIQGFSPSRTNLNTLRETWLEACLDFNEGAAEQALNQAFAIYPTEIVCIEVLQQGLHDIGEMWYQNRATIQQEHFTCALAHRRLDALMAAAPPPTRSKTILVGCTPSEQHTFPSLLIALLLRRNGYRVVYLGAEVPNQQYNETLQAVRPQLIILAAQQLHSANEVLEIAANLRFRNNLVSYGGRIFNLEPELRSFIPAHFLGETLQDAIKSAESLLTSNKHQKEATQITKQDKELYKAFIQNRSKIAVNILKEIANTGIPKEYSPMAIQNIEKNLSAALAFGKIDIISRELDWVRGLFRARDQASESLNILLKLYVKSIDMVMGKSGQPISSWLKTQAGE